MWNKKKKRITNNLEHAAKNIRVNLMLYTSKWLERFKEEAVDYWLEKQFPNTLKTLEWLKDSDFMKAILEVDGSARHTRLQCTRRFVLGNTEDDFQEGPFGRNNSGVGPSSTANNIV
jgi:hypothetical protein